MVLDHGTIVFDGTKIALLVAIIIAIVIIMALVCFQFADWFKCVFTSLHHRINRTLQNRDPAAGFYSAVFSDLAAPAQDLSCGPLPSALPALPSR